MKHNKLFYNIVNGPSEADIFIYGVIGSSWWESGVSASQFVKDFRALEEKYSRINIHINSPGGSIWDGLPIANIIRASKRDTHTYVDGIAYSMGGIIAISGKTMHMASNAMLMIHNASTIAVGHAQDLRTAADELDKYDDSLLQTISDKTGIATDKVKADWFDYKDHYFTAQEALDNKLCDVVENYKSEKMPDNVKNMSQKDLFDFYSKMDEEQESNWFTNIVNRVRESLTTSKENTEVNNTTPTMEFKNTLDILKKDSISAEDKTAIQNEVNAFIGANEKFTSDEVAAKVNDALKPVQDQVSDLNTKITALTTAATEKDAEIERLKALAPTEGGNVRQDGKDQGTKPDDKSEFITDYDKQMALINS